MKWISSLIVLMFFLLASQPALAVNRSAASAPATEMAVSAEKAMSKKQKRQMRKQARKQLRAKIKEMAKTMDTDLLLLVIVTILLPPLGMFLYEGEINNRFWISLLLTLLFYLPGLIYTLVVILGEN